MPNKLKAIKITMAPPAKKSSQVEGVGYDQASQTLAVKFSNGGSYHYHDVSQQMYDDLCKADSIGSHLHKHIKQCKCTKL